ncbi:MAG: hypothetical protein IJV56_03380 [Neisseriaceae bacterium]|nr:hypothetical protein [Neisseriaceae bacterium]MBQ9724366.1 hypothetical protein [Neisseriaceae bacterium]
MEEIYFPEYIDSPPQFMFLEIDDLMPVAGGLFVGLLGKLASQSNTPVLIGFVLGCLATYAYIAFKRNQLPGTLKAFMYNYTSVPLNKKWTNGFLTRTEE